MISMIVMILMFTGTIGITFSLSSTPPPSPPPPTPACSSVHPACLECTGEGAGDCLLCAHEYHQISGECIGKDFKDLINEMILMLYKIY